jgi:hypothetical protein
MATKKKGTPAMHRFHRICASILIACSGLFLAACQQQEPAEEQELEEVGEELRDTAEDVGQRVEEAAEEIRETVQDEQ